MVYKDGWRRIAGYMVYTENGVIVKGLINDGVVQIEIRDARKKYSDDWKSVESIGVENFRQRVKRGTARLA
jgi:hypothetical protein|uniref:Uncharacterized protein n=2 Tax=unclassified Caudoviricetes TaxID=2788787 RepID=A0A8S5U2Q9_9CAUD|nr:MAG TPA: hypothetical protein [Podoviridae sp. cte242]DAF88709.1 MAG TPA: hypothetical protein [Podoviridae sp. ctCDM29]